MARIFTLDHLQWGVTFLLNTGLIVLLLLRRSYRVFPCFFLYILLNFLHGVVVFESYRVWGFNSIISFKIYWGTRALVIMARILAVTETCQRALAKRWGFWELVWRVSLVLAMLVFLCAWAVGRHSPYLIVLTTERALELAIASGIVMVFLFAQHSGTDLGQLFAPSRRAFSFIPASAR